MHDGVQAAVLQVPAKTARKPSGRREGLQESKPTAARPGTGLRLHVGHGQPQLERLDGDGSRPADPEHGAGAHAVDPDHGLRALPTHHPPLHRARNQAPLLRTDGDWQDCVHGAAVVGDGQGFLHADLCGVFGQVAVCAGAGPDRREAGSPAQGRVRAGDEPQGPDHDRRPEHAREGEVRRAAADRNPAASDGEDAVRLRVVRSQGLGFPFSGGHQLPHRDGPAGRGEERRHGSLLPHVQPGLRHAVRRRIFGADLLHGGRRVLLVARPRRRGAGAGGGWGGPGRVHHGDEGLPPHPSEIALHLQHARRLEGVPGHVRMPAGIAAEGGGPLQGVDARVRAGVPGSPHQPARPEHLQLHDQEADGQALQETLRPSCEAGARDLHRFRGPEVHRVPGGDGP
mmetsp:Transcript_19771/g.49775  ORF Transcript_19771/g.49775 Transcript_19771/m.49775 type:complete len:399 (-) Transcript_19771:6025-7221(-)